ncbi:CinA family protein, partial [Campylobacter sp.]|uniref:CinA family protein n=1 Tax=Campylobacter sp. TaxID=205 RepID=UPI0026DDCB6D
MKHLLFIIGDELILHPSFKDCIFRSYEEKFLEIQELRFQGKSDKELPFLLEKLTQKYSFITIFSSPQNYPLIAKVLATLSEDKLVLKDHTLVPDRSLNAQNSFLCELKGCKINLLKATPEEKIPPLLGEANLDYAYFCLFGIDEESAILLLQTLTKSYEVSIKSTPLLPHLTLIKASSLKHGTLEGFLQSIKALFEGKFFLAKDPLRLIFSKLKSQGLKISFAESCTGGLCASELTRLEGAS